ncbi:MAG: iron ABC transporter substrate-binding protein [Candidatus Thermoplasmatota archaeon]|nr:iron ABC transporter substrate-binding protein [Candidatus Thermoplasmatota archaeon]
MQSPHKNIMLSITVIAMVGVAFGSGYILGSSTAPSGTQNTVTVTDMAGRNVQVPTDVQRVVGIEAGALRLLVYLNATDRVVGVEDIEQQGGKPYNYAYPDLADRPVIGPIHGGDPELITAVRPDVIFWTYTEAGEADDLQAQTGIPVVALSYGDLDDNRATFYQALRLTGSILGKQQRAEAVVSYINATIEDLDTRTRNISDHDRPSCYIGGIAYRGAHGIVSTEPDYAPFAFVNARNVASGLAAEHAFVDIEAIIEWDPHVLFIDEGGSQLVVQDITNRSVLASVEAIRQGRVYGVLPYNWYTTNYGTVLADAYYIGSVLYPAAFSDIEPVSKANEIYRMLLGSPVYEDMQTAYGGFTQMHING